MNFSNSLSVTSALSVVPFQEKLNTPSRSSTRSANHSCKPAGVLKNSYKMPGEHLTGYSIVYNTFLLILIFYIFLVRCNYKKIINLTKFLPLYFDPLII